MIFHYMDISHFIYQLMDIWDCFYFLATVHNDAVNTGAQVFAWMNSLEIYLGMELWVVL